MKKSRCIELVLITAALASCNQPKKDWDDNNKVHLRSDSTAPYTRVHHHSGLTDITTMDFTKEPVIIPEVSVLIPI